jgi:Tfp pilus assembly PilM family ATPase
MQRKGDQFVLTNFILHPLDEGGGESPEGLARNIKAVVKEMGGSRPYAVALSAPDSLIRVVDQPETPREVLRDALRLNGGMLLNHDCKEYVMDCGELKVESRSGGNTKRYLAVGMARTQIAQFSSALGTGGVKDVGSLQPAAISLLNAFEFAQREVFEQGAFFLLDIGQFGSTMIVGGKKDVEMVRTMDFGGHAFVEALQGPTGESYTALLEGLENDDEVLVENARFSLLPLAREVGSSVGFYEGRHEQTIQRIYVSGGISKNTAVLRILAEELGLPVTTWNVLENCYVQVPVAKQELLHDVYLDLAVAAGAAIELLQA